MVSERVAGSLAAAGAVPLLLAGASALKWYVFDIAIRQAREPDRSMLFWGLPIVFVGLALIGVGSLLAAYSYRKLRRPASTE